ncbi:MAG: cca [Paucimonas sp.]|jgi:tRNA nucleotidyltransferase (CCA-adding enzyme)|nr:cca [Paucimonas sp.]
MRIYIVGGAVRDELLGLPVQDRDYVVVGATPEQMIALGFTPVGKDFPVFLHPLTHEEHALARTERKTALGYKGFEFFTSPDVTLEEDLARRDLTINAMARDEHGNLIDPFGGRADLLAGIFRHVSPAFAEDPVRILRVARFAARFTGFKVAPETNQLMRNMVDTGEVDALVPERAWQEMARGLMEQKPSRMFEVLRACGALARILPELDGRWGMSQMKNVPSERDAGAHVMTAIDQAARGNLDLPVRFAILVHDLGKGQADADAQSTAPSSGKQRHRTHESPVLLSVDRVCARFKIPNDCRDLALMMARDHAEVDRAFEMRADAVVSLLERCDVFRKPQRFISMLQAAECVHRGRPGLKQHKFPQKSYLEGAMHAARGVDAGAVAREVTARLPAQPQWIPEQVRAARIAAVSSFIHHFNIPSNH